MATKPVKTWVVLLACLGPWAATVPLEAAPPATVMVAQPTDVNAELNGLLAKLGEIGNQMAKASTTAEMVTYNLQQAELMAQIAGRSNGEEKTAWLRRMADCLNVAALNSTRQDPRALKQLVWLETCIQRSMPGTALAARVTYQEMQADYAMKLAGAGDKLETVQLEWRGRLAQFVQAYPQAEETPRALLELGQVSEFLSQKAEAERYYGLLAQRYAGQAPARKAEGALRRLELEGKALYLALPLLDSPYEHQDVPFDIEELRGKVVIVYFWASCEGDCAGEFQVLKQTLGRYQSKGVELLCVNLDKSPEEAKAFLQRMAMPGTHVFQRGGFEGVVAVRYGVTVLPSLILVDRDGKVLAETTDLTQLERELRKRLTPGADK